MSHGKANIGHLGILTRPRLRMFHYVFTGWVEVVPREHPGNAISDFIPLPEISNWSLGRVGLDL